jgi:hypothetical protein
VDDGPDARLRRREHRIDEQLRELAEMGELTRLPGEGAPLVDDDPNAGERWAARHVAKNANVTPEFVELRREIADRRDRLVRRLRAHRLWLEDRAALLHDLPAEQIIDAARATTDFDSRLESELRSAMSEINALVARHNLKVPLALQIPPLSLEHLRGRP